MFEILSVELAVLESLDLAATFGETFRNVVQTAVRIVPAQKTYIGIGQSNSENKGEDVQLSLAKSMGVEKANAAF